jgi:hypothetical protein
MPIETVLAVMTGLAVQAWIVLSVLLVVVCAIYAVIHTAKFNARLAKRELDFDRMIACLQQGQFARAEAILDDYMNDPHFVKCGRHAIKLAHLIESQSRDPERDFADCDRYAVAAEMREVVHSVTRLRERV